VAEYLVIRLGRNADAPVQWIAVDDSGARLGSPASGSLPDAANDIGERKVIALVPAVDVLTTTVEIPLKSNARIQAALPFALEEFLADDVENLHFAAGARRDSQKIPASVVRREKMNAWIEALTDAGIAPVSIIADNQGLARIPGTISLLLAENQIFINDGNDIELVLQDLGPADALACIGALDTGQASVDAEEAEDAGPVTSVSRHVLVYCEPGEDDTYAREWIGIRHDFDSLDIKVLPDGILPRLAVTVGAGAGVNLLQGEFGARTEYAIMFRPWKYAAILLLVLTGTLMAAKSVNYYQMSKLEVQLQEKFLQDYQQIVPGATEVRDPVAAVSSLRSRSGNSDAPELLLESLHQLSRAMLDNQAAHIEAISYRAGVVDIRLSAPSVAVLDSIRQIIDANGAFSAKILSTDQDGETVNSRIQIQASGA